MHAEPVDADAGTARPAAVPADPPAVEALPLAERAAAYRLVLDDLHRRLEPPTR